MSPCATPASLAGRVYTGIGIVFVLAAIAWCAAARPVRVTAHGVFLALSVTAIGLGFFQHALPWSERTKLGSAFGWGVGLLMLGPVGPWAFTVLERSGVEYTAPLYAAVYGWVPPLLLGVLSLTFVGSVKPGIDLPGTERVYLLSSVLATMLYVGVIGIGVLATGGVLGLRWGGLGLALEAMFWSPIALAVASLGFVFASMPSDRQPKALPAFLYGLGATVLCLSPLVPYGGMAPYALFGFILVLPSLSFFTWTSLRGRDRRRSSLLIGSLLPLVVFGSYIAVAMIFARLGGVNVSVEGHWMAEAFVLGAFGACLWARSEPARPGVVSSLAYATGCTGLCAAVALDAEPATDPRLKWLAALSLLLLLPAMKQAAAALISPR